MIGEQSRIAHCVSCHHQFVLRLPDAPPPAALEPAAGMEEEAPLFLEVPDSSAGEAESETTLVRKAMGPPPDVEMPDEPAEPVGLGRLGDGKAADASLETRRRWRDPLRAQKKRPSLFGPAGEKAQPSSGSLYKIIVILIGAVAFTTSFLNIGEWKVDPVWSLTMVALGILAFRLQSLSGLLVAGLFCFFYPLTLFSQEVPAIAGGEITGVILIGAQTAIAVLILLVYGILMARKRALFVLLEGNGHSLTALVMGLLTLLLVTWAHADSAIIPAMAGLAPTGTPLGSISYYSSSAAIGIGFPVLLQAWALSLSIAFGFSARAVRNRLLMLANLGLLIGFIALLFLYAPLVVGEIRLTIP